VCFVFIVWLWKSPQDSQCAPCIFVDHLRQGTQVIPRLHTKQDISSFFLQIVSQDSWQELFRHTISPYHDVSRIDFQFCCLRTRFVSNGVFCLYSVDFGVSWTSVGVERSVTETELVMIMLQLFNSWNCKKIGQFPDDPVKVKFTQCEDGQRPGSSHTGRYERNRVRGTVQDYNQHGIHVLFRSIII